MKKLLLISSILILANTSYAYDGLGNQFTTKTNSNVQVFVQNRTAGNFTIQSVVENGISIKQYVDSSDNIFAVTWSGVSTPDFSTLLGKYVNFQDTEKDKNVKNLTHNIIHDKDLVIGKNYSGRLKRGYAYLTSLVPSNFDITTLSQ